MANNTSVNKQNKLLLGALVVILASSAVLVGVTGSANKRKSEENPPLEKQTEQSEENKTENTDTQTPETDVKTEKENKTDEKEKTTPEVKPDEPSKPSKETKPTEKTDAEPEETVEVIAEDVLPSFIAPVDSIVIKGASLATPVFSYTMNDYRTHSGLDFAASAGTPVCAAADGVISEVYDDPMMGVTVAVSHSGGAETKYKGLAEETLSMHAVGDTVAKGDVIGVSGDTALIESGEEDHVHFELSVNGEAKDPAEYVEVVFLKDLVED